MKSFMVGVNIPVLLSGEKPFCPVCTMVLCYGARAGEWVCFNCDEKAQVLSPPAPVSVGAIQLLSGDQRTPQGLLGSRPLI